MYKETQLVQHFSPTSLSILNIFKKLFAGKNPEAEEKGSGKGVKKKKMKSGESNDKQRWKQSLFLVTMEN